MEEEASEMEVEEQSEPISKPYNRFGLKNSIQTNFGDDYVFQIVSNDDCTSMAVSLSTNVVKLYSPLTGQYLGECKGHSASINNISFTVPSTSPHVLHSCASDGTVRVWDTRTFQQVSCISAGPAQEVFSCSFGGTGSNLLAAGCKSQVIFWDWRNKKQIGNFEESHVDDVTQVHFVPENENRFVSASVDGLMCVFDTSGNINEYDHLESVMNVGTSIGKVGFFGEMYRKLWCLTHIETLSTWDWKDGKIEANFHDTRSLVSDRWTLDQVDYFVDCHYSREDERLWVIGGTNSGYLGFFPVNYKGVGAIGSPEAILGGGHTGVVRSVLPISSILGRPGHSQHIFGWSGGEDGRLCCWLSDDSPNINRSWISSGLVVRSPRTRPKGRHSPY